MYANCTICKEFPKNGMYFGESGDVIMPINPSPNVEKTLESKRERDSVWHMDISDLVSSKLLGRGRRIPTRKLALFNRTMSVLLGAGVSIGVATHTIAQHAPKQVLGATVWDLHRLILQGESFSCALRLTKVFPPFMCNYIETGEQTAKLPEVCAYLADFYDERARAEAEIKSVMMYPSIIATMMLGVIIMAIVFVLPGYAHLFDASGIDLPPLTSALMTISDFLINNTLAVIFVFGVVVFMGIAFFRSSRGQEILSVVKIRIPIFREELNFRFAQTMSLLLASGISISDAIPMCSEIMDNIIVRRDLKKLSTKVNTGVPFWCALSEIKYINPMFVELAMVGEDTGNLPKAIAQCNNYFEESYKKSLRRHTKLIEPIITLVLGVVLAVVMLAIILPTFQLATAF